MPDHSQDHLQILAQLAKEYEQKHDEMAGILKDVQPERAIQQLRLRAELTTDRFRAAQQALLSNLSGSEHDREAAKKAAVALCRCFDEMRILFQCLIKTSSGFDGS